MGLFQKFRLVVRENDFVEVRRSKDGTEAWFSNAFLHRWHYKQRNRILGDGPVGTEFENVSDGGFIAGLVGYVGRTSSPNDGTTQIVGDAWMPR